MKNKLQIWYICKVSSFFYCLFTRWRGEKSGRTGEKCYLLHFWNFNFGDVKCMFLFDSHYSLLGGTDSYYQLSWSDPIYFWIYGLFKSTVDFSLKKMKMSWLKSGLKEVNKNRYFLHFRHFKITDFKYGVNSPFLQNYPLDWWWHLKFLKIFILFAPE